MRKLIDIPENIVTDLKVLAALSDKDLKNYIQDVIRKDVKKNRDLINSQSGELEKWANTQLEELEKLKNKVDVKGDPRIKSLYNALEKITRESIANRKTNNKENKVEILKPKKPKGLNIGGE